MNPRFMQKEICTNPCHCWLYGLFVTQTNYRRALFISLPSGIHPLLCSSTTSIFSHLSTWNFPMFSLLMRRESAAAPFTYTHLENRRERQNPKRLGFSTRPRHEKSPDAGNPTSGLWRLYFRGCGKADRSSSTAARFSPMGRSFGRGRFLYYRGRPALLWADRNADGRVWGITV